MKRRAVLLLAGLFLFATTGRAGADEGLARITDMGDRDLVAQQKKKNEKPHYKSVETEEEDDASEYFKGTPPRQINNLFVGLGTDYFDGFGLQARFANRIIDKGFIPDLNNSFYIEGGVGLTFYGSRAGTDGVTGFDFVLTGRWDFQLDKHFIFFADVGLGVNAVSNDRKSDVRGGGVFPCAGVGMIVNFNNSEWAARADLSYQFTGIGVVRRF